MTELPPMVGPLGILVSKTSALEQATWLSLSGNAKIHLKQKISNRLWLANGFVMSVVSVCVLGHANLAIMMLN